MLCCLNRLNFLSKFFNFNVEIFPVSVKNISAGYLEVEAQDLTERFIRGDKSRQTEGSGLGLSIAKSLVEAQGGEFEIQVDGDLFKAIIKFDQLK